MDAPDNPKTSHWVKLLASVIAAGGIMAASTITAKCTARQEVASLRVESGAVSSNNLGTGTDFAWQPWSERLSDRTHYVGVQGHVKFKKAFEDKPQIVTALRLINLPPLNEVLRQLGHQESPDKMQRLHQLHVVAWTGYEGTDGFTLYVGIGLPDGGAIALISALNARQVQNSPDSPFEFHRQKGGLPAGQTIEQLNPDQRWVMNFYTLVGTIDVSWIATAHGS